jgi:hypothetical protein
MRYLFGDSAPFPLAVNFLATLEVFMTTATRAVELELRAQSGLSQAADLARSRALESEGLEAFHASLMRQVRETASHASHEASRQYAAKLEEFATRWVEDHKAQGAAQGDGALAKARAEADTLKGEMLAHMETFFRSAELTPERTELSLRLTATGYEGAGVFLLPSGITCGFRLDAASWQSASGPGGARRVGEFAPKLELRVALKKAWLKSTISAEPLDLSDHLVSELHLDDTRLVIKLRRKSESKDALTFIMSGDRIAVEHPGDPLAESAQGIGDTLEGADVPAFQTFAKALRDAGLALVSRKTKLMFVRLDGVEIGPHPVIPLVQRLVHIMAPTVREIAQRSPSTHELSLKRESDDGRREELYLRREDIAKQLQPLPAAGRRVFALLGLEAWLPGVTQAPPSVAPVGQAEIGTAPSALPGSSPASTPLPPELADLGLEQE